MLGLTLVFTLKAHPPVTFLGCVASEEWWTTPSPMKRCDPPPLSARLRGPITIVHGETDSSDAVD
jgi:hypothetical protein